MAITKIKPVHKGEKRNYKSAIKNIITYIMDLKKTNNGKLVNSYECADKTIVSEWNMTRSLYRRLTNRENSKEVVAYHLIQSFKPGEVEEVKALSIGNELAKAFTKGKYQYIVCTHNDMDHLHNHIVINAISIDGKRKFRNFWNSSKALRRLSDRICLENGLSIIESPKNCSISYEKWLNHNKNKPHREAIKEDMDIIISDGCVSFEMLISELENREYKIKYGKEISLKGKGQKSYVRLSSLKAGYTEEDLKRRFNQSAGKVVKEKISLLINIDKKLQEGKGKGYEKWSKVFNLKQMAKSINYLREHDIDDLETLKQKVKECTKTYNDLNNHIKEIEYRIKVNNDLKKAIIDYMNTKEVYYQYKKMGYNQNYKKSHEVAITKFLNARKIFNELELKKLPKIKDLHSENGQLINKKRELYSKYKDSKISYQELLKVKANIESLLRDKKCESNKYIFLDSNNSDIDR